MSNTQVVLDTGAVAGEIDVEMGRRYDWKSKGGA